MNYYDTKDVVVFFDGSYKKRNKYKMGVVGAAENQYHILKINNLQQERKQKILEIENKKQKI